MISPFSQYLAEVFDQPYPLRVHSMRGAGKRTQGIYYTARTDTADRLDIEISEWGGVGRWRIDFTVNQSIDMTHAGKPWRILATVMDAVKKFMEWHRLKIGTAEHPYPEEFVISFSSSDFSRYKAYTAMIRRFAHKYRYIVGSAVDDDDMGETVITLERQKS
jgi:hypothetical protein